MKPSKIKVYDAFGELIYAMALADGLIQPEETEALEKILLGHPMAKEIQWSVDYENKKHHSVQETYKKAIGVFEDHGPDPDYAFLMEVLDTVANASDGTQKEESDIMDHYQTDLKARFIKDLEEQGLHYFDND